MASMIMGEDIGECAAAMRVMFAGKKTADARLVEDSLFGDGFTDREVECALMELGVAATLRRFEPGGDISRSWSIESQTAHGTAV